MKSTQTEPLTIERLNVVTVNNAKIAGVAMLDIREATPLSENPATTLERWLAL